MFDLLVSCLLVKGSLYLSLSGPGVVVVQGQAGIAARGFLQFHTDDQTPPAFWDKPLSLGHQHLSESEDPKRSTVEPESFQSDTQLHLQFSTGPEKGAGWRVEAV